MTARDNAFVSHPTPPSCRSVPGLAPFSTRQQTWIPAFAGMTVEGVCRGGQGRRRT
jgi:hypothetical protein